MIGRLLFVEGKILKWIDFGSCVGLDDVLEGSCLLKGRSWSVETGVLEYTC